MPGDYEIETVAHEKGYVKADVDGLIPGGLPAAPVREGDRTGDSGKDGVTETDGGAVYRTELNVDNICKMIHAIVVCLLPSPYACGATTYDNVCSVDSRRPLISHSASRHLLMLAATCVSTYSARRCAVRQSRREGCCSYMCRLKICRTALRKGSSFLKSSLLRLLRKGRGYGKRGEENCELNLYTQELMER